MVAPGGEPGRAARPRPTSSSAPWTRAAPSPSSWPRCFDIAVAVRRHHHQRARHGGLRAAARVRRLHPRAVPPVPGAARRARSACTATTTSAWPRPTRWPRCAPAPRRSSAPSTASASAPATPRSKRSSWPSRTRGEYFGATTGVDTEEIARTQPPGEQPHRLRRSSATRRSWGATPSPTRRGIHQAGVLNESSTFEIMKPADVGLADSDLVLGKHSGRHALRAKLAELGYRLTDAELDEAFHRFKDLADKKKEVTALDLEALVERGDPRAPGPLHAALASSTRRARRSPRPARSRSRCAASGERGKSFSNGTVESGLQGHRQRRGHQAAAWPTTRCGRSPPARTRWPRSSVAVEVDGRSFNGQAVSFDVMEASAKAYVRAMNNAAAARGSRDGITRS